MKNRLSINVYAVFFLALMALSASVVSASAITHSRIETDLAAVSQLRSGLKNTLDYIVATPEVFHAEGQEELPGRDEKNAARGAWKRILDYTLALEVIEDDYRDFRDIEDQSLRGGAFQVFYGAFLAQYRFALEFLHEMEHCSYADTVFNEAQPDLGLPERAFAGYKFRFLNIAIATEFAALNVIDRLDDHGGFAGYRGLVDADRSAIWQIGKGKGEAMTLKNARKIVADTGFGAWLPVQKSVSRTMGRIKVRRQGENLITDEQVRRLAGKLEPGDILLERREWYMSNVGLPGFWTHVALYVGTPEEREAFFADPDVSDWLRRMSREGGDFGGLLKDRYPEAFRNSEGTDEKGHRFNVLEAIEEGVTFTALEKSAAADSLAVLRPRLSRVEKAIAVMRAFGYAGRPYDFNFDFLTDAALVCSELIFKAYEPANDYQGLSFPQTRIAGRLVTPPNELAGQFDAQWGTEAQQTDLVVFLDGFESENLAVTRPLEVFRETWKRPKWHIFVQEDAPKKVRGKNEGS